MAALHKKMNSLGLTHKKFTVTWDSLYLGMHDDISMSSVSANTGFKIKHQHQLKINI